MGGADRKRDDLVAEILALRERARLPTVVPPSAAPSPPGAGRYRHLLEGLRAMLVEIDEQGQLVFASPTVKDILGYEPEEVLQRLAMEWVHEEDLASLADSYARIGDTGDTLTIAYRARHKQGHWVWLETTSISYRTAEGRPRTLAFTRDVSDIHRAGAALRESEDRFRAMTENAADLFSELDSEGRFLYVSPNCEQILGLRPEQIIGQSLAEPGRPGGIHPDDRERLVEGYRHNIVGRGRGQIEFRLLHADGTWHWFEGRGSAYRTHEGEMRAVVVSRDISERKRSQDELRESEERYRVIAETSRDLITETDAEGRLVYVSPTCPDVLGFEVDEVLGTTPFGLVHPDDIERCVAVFLEAVRSGGPARTDPFRVRHKNGEWRWFEGAAITYERSDGSVRLLSVARDINDRKRAEEERAHFDARLQQAQKLESLGVLAGGIAHDFNNLLTPILGDASLALQDVPEDSPAHGRLLKIKKAAQRAATLTQQMLAYTGKESLRIEVIDVSRLVREIAQLLESAVSRSAVLVYDLRDDLPAVEADSSQLSQVAMNLITNASEAVGEVEGEGRIVVRTGTMEVDADYAENAALSNPIEPGDYVFFEVTDTGCGMDADTRSRIFDPFFTTKFTGRGLGLAAVLGIVRGHRGAIEIESAPGRGTRFRVLLPRSAQSPSRRTPPPPGGTTWRSRGTILVVDDDEGVRDLTSETLRRCGLTVLCAADGGEAVKLFEKHADEIRAVLLDRTMPATSGEVVFDAIRQIRPDARILLASGYSQESTADHFSGKGVAGFLQKPFLPETLIEKLREVLGE